MRVVNIQMMNLLDCQYVSSNQFLANARVVAEFESMHDPNLSNGKKIIACARTSFRTGCKTYQGNECAG